MPLEWFLALRFLREGRTQTLLLVIGASVGVLLVVFLSALMDGLQRDLLSKTLGTQPHVVLRVPDEAARRLRAPGQGLGEDELVAARVLRPTQRLRTIPDWPKVLAQVGRDPVVTATSPLCTGPALASRGGASKAVALFGVEPRAFDAVYQVGAHLVTGRFDPAGDQAVIGRELAEDLGIGVGDKLRLSAERGQADVFTVAGIFDLGIRDVNRRWVLLSLRAAQAMLELPGGITQIDLRVREVFAAPEVAAALASRTKLTAEPWTATNAQLLAGLKGQAGSSQLIQAFVLIGLAVAIASVLVISVVQRQRQIGIMRAMGSSRALVSRVFLIQGGLVALLGALVGSSTGALLVWLFTTRGAVQFPIDLGPMLFLRATAVALATGLLAALLPARRAAGLEPAVAIRHE